MKILSFDQSTVKTGWAVFNKGRLAHYGLIDLSKNKLKSNERILVMADEIAKIVDHEKPNMVIIEDVMQVASPATMKILAELLGFVKAKCHWTGKPVEVMTPTRWRKNLGFLQGKTKREEVKAQAKRYVQRVFNKEPSEDECDAICIGYSYLIEQKGEKENGK